MNHNDSSSAQKTQAKNPKKTLNRPNNTKKYGIATTRSYLHCELFLSGKEQKKKTRKPHQTETKQSG